MAVPIQQFESFLENVRIPIRLACKTSSGWPVVISLWFIHLNGKLFCATQKSAKVISYIQNDPRVGFEIAEDRQPYCGIRGQATASLDKTKGKEILEQLLTRYLGGTDTPLGQQLLGKAENEIAIVLDPKLVYTWNFSNRMQHSSHVTKNQSSKICPDLLMEDLPKG